MSAIRLDSSEDQFIISIDKKSISKDVLIHFIDNLRLETLAEKVDFDEDIEKLDEDIKDEWWQAKRFISGENE